MYSKKLSVDQGGRNHSIFNTEWAKETAIRVKNAVRAYTIRIAWVTLAAAGGSMMVDAAQASDSFDTTPHKVVGFKDLNLNSPEGVAVLYGRIKSAATEVCGKRDRLDLSQLHAVQICIDEAVSRAVAQVNRPMLTSLYEARTGKPVKQTATLAQTR
jgi:UrcA family protein